MTLGCLADCYDLLPRDWRVIEKLAAIMILFGMGHVAYISGALCWANQLGLRNRTVWLASWTFCLLLGATLWCLIVPGAPKLGSYGWAALGYTLLLSTTAGTMVGAALQQRRFTAMAIGSLSFLASDAVLAVVLFHEVDRRLGAAVWLTYGLGQMLIVYGATAAASLRSQAT
jgi:uncharacterized membrane protein YhhN